MNPKYHGDAKDFFKRGILDSLEESGIMRGPDILPMFTGAALPPNYIAIYARILGVEEKHIVQRTMFRPKAGRRDYFMRGWTRRVSRHDLFLDPDRGFRIEPKNDRSDREIVTLTDLANILPKSTDRIVLIFDDALNHADRVGEMVEKVDELCAKRRYSAFAYLSAAPNTPSLLFVASANAAAILRMDRVREYLKNILGVPSHRIIEANAALRKA